MNLSRKIIVYLFIVTLFFCSACSAFENSKNTITTSAEAVVLKTEEDSLHGSESNASINCTLEALKSDQIIHGYFYNRYEEAASTNFAIIQEDKAVLQFNKDALNEITDMVMVKAKNENDFIKTKYFVAKLLYDNLTTSTNISTISSEYQNASLNGFDYRIRFKGCKDILLSLKDQRFCFEGEKEVYVIHLEKKEGDDLVNLSGNGMCKFYGLKKSLLNNKFVYSEAILCSTSYDINSDLVIDNIDVLYNGSLKLQVNNSYLELENGNLNGLCDLVSTIESHPIIDINVLGTNKGKQNYIIFSTECATNKVGSTANFRVFTFDRKGINEISYDEPKVTAKYKGTQKVFLEVPKFGVHTNMVLDEEIFKTRKSQLVDIFNGEAIHHSLTFQCKDFDNDGYNELRLEKLVYVGPWIYLCHLNTYYKNKNGEIMPYKVAIDLIK